MKAAETTEWKIESLYVENKEFRELSDKEFEEITNKEAEEIFQTLYYGLPAATFKKLVEKFDNYNNEVDGN